MVGHGHRDDLVPLVAYHNHGLVAGGKELVLLQRAVEHIDAGGSLALEATAQQLQGAALLTGADQAGVDDGGVVHRRYQGGAAVGLLILQGSLKAGGDQNQKEDQSQTDGKGRVVAALIGIQEKGCHETDRSFRMGKKDAA